MKNRQPLRLPVDPYNRGKLNLIKNSRLFVQFIDYSTCLFGLCCSFGSGGRSVLAKIPYGEFGDFNRLSDSFRATETHAVGNHRNDAVNLLVTDCFEARVIIETFRTIFELVSRSYRLPLTVHKAYIWQLSVRLPNSPST